MLIKSEIQKRADELNILAANGKPLPDGLSLPEQLYFLALRSLYTDYRRKTITVEQAKAEKNKLSESFVDNMYNYELYNHQAKIQAIFARNYQDIRNNGCEVCQRLDKILCGLDN